MQGFAAAERAALDHQGRGSVRGAGQLQTAAGDQADAVGLADHHRHAPRPGGVLDGGQHLLVVAAADEDQPLGRKAERGKSRCVEVVAPQHPNRRAASRQGPGQQGRERARRRAGLDLHPLRRQRMPGPQRQPAARQAAVDPLIAERQHAVRRAAGIFQSGDLAAQGLQAVCARHEVSLALRFVPFLF